MTIFSSLISLAIAAAFQDYSVGMSLAEARAVPIPEDKYGPVRLTCASDTDAPRFLETTEVEKEIGIERCWPTQWIGSSHVRASLAIGGGANATTEFLFFKGQLFQIKTIYDEMHRTSIEKALRKKYGDPTGKVDRAVQNLYGAEFEQNLLTWDVGDDRVTFLAPALTLRRMLVAYRDITISDQIDQIIENAEAEELSL